MALDTNLIAYWKLDESSGNASDSTANGKTLTNTGTVTYTTGKINNAGNFSGSSQYLTRASEAYFQITGALSISLWVNADTLSADRQLVSKNDNNISNSEFGIIYRSTGKFAFFSANASNYYYLSTNSTYSATNWYHVVVTRAGSSSGSAVLIYVNGSSVATTVDSTDPSFVGTSSYPLNIGSQNNNNSAFDGKIDEVGIWTRELTSAEVTQLYNSGNGLSYPFGNSYTLAITKGAYTLTGIATAFRRALNILITKGTYVYTGIATAFNRGKGFQAITGSYILTGNNALFGKVISMLAISGSYAYTGFATGLAKTKLLIASVGNYIYNGIATGISHGRKITITKGTYTYTGFAVAVHRGVVLIAVTGNYVLRGFNARMSIYWKNITKNVVSWVNEKKSNV